jgi:hypothetical protein
MLDNKSDMMYYTNNRRRHRLCCLTIEYVTFSVVVARKVRDTVMWSRRPMSSNGSIPLASLLIHICPHSTAVVQRFCKPKAGSSILSGGTSFSNVEQQVRAIGEANSIDAREKKMLY